MKINSPLLRLSALLLCGLTFVPTLPAADESLPPNLGRGLRPLVEWHRSQPAGRNAAERRTALVNHFGTQRVRPQVDRAGNIAVDIRLTGAVPAADVKRRLAALGLTLEGEHVARRPDGRDGMLSARLPLDQAVAAAKVPGVQSVLVAHQPENRAGKVPGQGLAPLYATAAQVGNHTGSGISVGVLSDSYNLVTPSAAADVASGDLPSGVVVLNESTDTEFATDEGRAMMQIIHDVAPGAKLSFSTTGDYQTTFAANIRQLRTDSRSLCDVIVDDVGFFDEPFFSDGIVSQAVDDVVTSTSLSGKRVIYYSAAGNDGSLDYQANWIGVSDSAVRAGTANSGPLKLNQVPAALTAGGFQNFIAAETGSGTRVYQRLTVSGADGSIIFQWDDPFVAGLLTTDYNILVFDSKGNFRQDDSGTDNNYSTGEAFEYASLPLNPDGSDTTYYIAITRASVPTAATPATRLRYLIQEDGGITGEYIHTGRATIYGHPGATNADGVAAYNYRDARTPESFSSYGPVTIVFDAMGNRLATPVVRLKPTIAGVDGVDTTFFPQPADENDSDNDGYPNFFGTSAAAPHLAGIAALLLEAGGGPGTITSTHMRSLLESTGINHDLDPGYASAVLQNADGTVVVNMTASGDQSDFSAINQSFFHFTLYAPVHSSLTQISIDMGPSHEVFDPSLSTGFPLTFGGATTIDSTKISSAFSAGSTGYALGKLTLTIPTGVFPSGGVIGFGVDRDVAGLGSGGNSADLLSGTLLTVQVVLANGTTVNLSGTVKNVVYSGWSPDAGYGRADAQAALQALQSGK